MHITSPPTLVLNTLSPIRKVLLPATSCEATLSCEVHAKRGAANQSKITVDIDLPTPYVVLSDFTLELVRELNHLEQLGEVP